MEIVIDKKQIQLGMNPSTASGRLVKDTLYRLIIEAGHNKCYRCGFPMTRETFSIEHKTPWIDSENPVELYFDQSNISFSHNSCNIKAARRPNKGKGTSTCGSKLIYQQGCRCEVCVEGERNRSKSRYTPEWRRERYKRTGN